MSFSVPFRAVWACQARSENGHLLPARRDSATGWNAPIPAVRRVTIEPLEATHSRPSAYAAAMNRTPLSSGVRLIEFSQRQSDLQPRVIDGFMEGQASSASAHLLKRGGAQRLSTA